MTKKVKISTSKKTVRVEKLEDVLRPRKPAKSEKSPAYVVSREYSRCTWEDCEKEAEFEELDKNDELWAELCKEHHQEKLAAIDDLVQGKGPKRLLRAWTLAQGGSKKAGARMAEKDGLALRRFVKKMVDALKEGK